MGMMSSSKVWRKGRWFWSCTKDNGASDWKDSWSCGAVSRLTYSTKEDAEKASQDYEALVQKAHAEAKQIIADSKAAGERVKNDLESIAKENVEGMIGKAKIQIEAESQKAIQEIKASVVDLSIEAATKAIEKNLDTEDNRKLVDQALDNMEQA